MTTRWRDSRRSAPPDYRRSSVNLWDRRPWIYPPRLSPPGVSIAPGCSRIPPPSTGSLSRAPASEAVVCTLSAASRREAERPPLDPSAFAASVPLEPVGPPVRISFPFCRSHQAFFHPVVLVGLDRPEFLDPWFLVFEREKERRVMNYDICLFLFSFW